MEDSLGDKFLQKLNNRKINDILTININSNEINNPKQNLQKFNVEKYEDKKNKKNSIKLCDKCNIVINSFNINEKMIKLLLNQPKQFYTLQTNNSSFINEILMNKKLCQNCLKFILEQFYFKEKYINNNYNLDEKEKEIINLFQVFENLDEEKLNINIKLYHIYKKLINSYSEYIKDNNNKDDKNYYNIKNHKIIGIDCILNIIDLLNKNISILKEKNLIKKQFLEDVIKEKDSLLKEIKNNNLKININEILKTNINENQERNIILKENINKTRFSIFNSENKIEIMQKNNNIRFTNNQNLFKTKIIKTKKKIKKLRRISKKIRFIIKKK